MKRTFEGKELLPLVHNCLRAEIGGDGFLSFSRFTEYQLERYREASLRYDYDFMPKTEVPSNVTLDFITDSDTLALTYRWEESITPYLSMDLLVDGVLWESFFKEDSGNKMAGFRLPEGSHRITLVFPWSVKFRLASLTLADGASLQTVGGGLCPNAVSEAPGTGDRLRILALGDSITQGYYALHPSLSYVGAMTRELDAECLNQAIGGFLFEDSVLDPALKNWKPDLITLAYGTNDFGFREGTEDFRTGVTGVMEKLTEFFPETKILGIMPIYRNDSNFFARRFIKNYTPEESHKVIREVYGNYPNVTVLEDNYFPHVADCFAPDYLHPNDLGFGFYARAVIGSLRGMLNGEAGK